MNFKDFITNRWHRWKITAEWAAYENVRPPKNPSRRYIDKLVARYIRKGYPRIERREIELIGAAAVPSIVAAIRDPRNHKPIEELGELEDLGIDTLLALLVPHAPADVIAIATPLADDASDKVRKTAAIHLASLGRAEAIPVLAKLLDDPDGFVRSYVAIGIRRALKEQRCDKEFRDQIYYLLLNQCDQEWEVAGNDAAKVLVALNAERAAKDLAQARWLSPDNPCVCEILDSCSDARIPLPEHLLRCLLEDSLKHLNGENSYPHDRIAAGTLIALARASGDRIKSLLEAQADSASKYVREGAARGLLLLNGVEDPVTFVLTRRSEVGYESLSIPQPTIYCACVFEAEVCNGGITQFFGNSSGDRAADTLEALRLLDHRPSYDALNTAMRLIGPLAREPDRDMRLAAFEGRYEELRSAFRPLEDAVYASSLTSAMLAHATKHPEQFREANDA